MNFVKGIGRLALRKIANEGGIFLNYVIRELSPIAFKFRDFGITMVQDNIGDPIKAGVKVEGWIKKIILDTAEDDRSMGYSSEAEGEASARDFVAQHRNSRKGVKISLEDVIFASGSSPIISEINSRLSEQGILLVPSPGYPAHSSYQAFNLGRNAVYYKLDPSNKWLPNLEDIKRTLEAYNYMVKGIIVINPGNPTGAVFPQSIIRGLVDICDEYGVLPIFDECYANTVYGGTEFVHLGDVIGGAPGISLRSMSKDVPWPGGRCGWMEAYNQEKHEHLKEFFEIIRQSFRQQASSTTLPQLALPKIYGDERFSKHLQEWNYQLEIAADMRINHLKEIAGLSVVRPQGAFYMAPIFEDGFLNESQELPVMNCSRRDEAENYLKSLLSQEPNLNLDKRLVYNLMANGIFVVPLTGFGPHYHGFRVTTLNPNIEQVDATYARLKELISQYQNSTNVRGAWI